MFEIFTIGLELLQDWNSPHRFQRWVARLGCVIVVIMVVLFTFWIIQLLTK